MMMVDCCLKLRLLRKIMITITWVDATTISGQNDHSWGCRSVEVAIMNRVLVLILIDRMGFRCYIMMIVEPSALCIVFE